ncbi:COP9 signalosome complex subunit 8-like isoform X3 [Aristolochia californica]|uniref:COP9 signalosome complex subunit 8-like isoform X3 n=1 Tax=Aristolochia californica TaxID=171875 RepID=UPI0035E2D9A3
MDFSLLNEALESKSYEKVADFCDELMLQAAAQGITFQDEWPYSIHLLGHLYINDVNSARFLWKSIPSPVKETRPEVVAVWKIGQRLWTRDYAGVHEAIRGFNWSPDVINFVAAFSDALQHGWTVDPASQMLTVKKLPVVREQKLNPSKLQRLTEYVFHLEH